KATCNYLYTVILGGFGCSVPQPHKLTVTPLPEPQTNSSRQGSGGNDDKSQLRPHAMMGKGLYNQKSSNSSLLCHGKDAKGGVGHSGVDLSQPKTWKVYLALGGDPAYQRDPNAFVTRMKTATISLIRDGAIIHNDRFKEPWFNWHAGGMTAYDWKMLGL